MNKALGVFAVVFLLSLAFAVGSRAGSSMAQGGFREYDSTKLVGSIVKSLDGEELGRILDLEIDSQGRVDLVLILQNGIESSPSRLVAVPFSALTISEAKSQQIEVGLNVDRKTFYAAPDFYSRDLGNPQWEAGIYRFFGQQPYWAEEEAGKVTKSPNQDCAYPYSLLGEWGCSLDRPFGK